MNFSGDEHTVRLLRAGLLWSALLLTALFAAAAIGIHHAFWLPACITAGAGAWLAVRYPLRFAAALQGTFDGQILQAHSGVLLARTIYIARRSLRNFELLAPPLHRHYGCRTLLLRFAGGTVILPCLPAQQALELFRAFQAEEKQA